MARRTGDENNLKETKERKNHFTAIHYYLVILTIGYVFNGQTTDAALSYLLYTVSISVVSVVPLGFYVYYLFFNATAVQIFNVTNEWLTWATVIYYGVISTTVYVLLLVFLLDAKEDKKK